jgi:cytochrome c oxidase subunit II
MIEPSRSATLIRRAPAVLGALAATLLLSGCDLSPQTTISPQSEFADDIQFLLKLTFFAAVGVGVIVEGILVYVILRYKARRTDTGFPAQIHGNTPVEIIWTIIPAVLLAVVAFFTIPIIFTTQAPPPAGSLTVNVIGHQWWWEFRYPDLKVVTANELHLPVGQTAAFYLDSADVMHSFWLPRLGGKRDVIPNHTNNLWWTACDIGTTPGQCAQFCGASHANMRMDVVVQSQADFNQWVTAQQAQPAQPDGGPAADGRGVFARSACIGCHTIEGLSSGEIGPDLTHVGSRGIIASGVLTNTPDNMAKWLHDPPAIKPGSLMPNLHLSDQDVNSLVAYLESLK